MDTLTRVTYARVTRGRFLDAFSAAREASPRVADATSTPEEMPADAWWMLASDGRSGYAIAAHRELIAAWSLERGRGDAIVADAVARGAGRLDCFDGYLPTLYARHGFREVAREANWTPGGPDVIYMSRLLAA